MKTYSDEMINPNLDLLKCNICKNLLGAGPIALPFVFRTFGILYGIIAIFFIGYLSHLGTVYLLKCKDITKK